MDFRHETVDPDPPCGRLGFCETTDLTGNGRPDVIVGGMGAPSLLVFGKEVARTLHRGPQTHPLLKPVMGLLETHVFWYENPGWERHALTADWDLHLDVGAALGDVDGDGRVDLLAGQGYQHNDVYWFRQPEDPREPWERHLLTDSYRKYHDLAFGDVDDDGEPEVVGLSQEGETVFYYDVPADPSVTPWPDRNRHVVAADTEVEGVAIVDLDGDGATDIVAGTSVYRRPSTTGDEWVREDIATGWDDTRVAVADLDGDGELEVVFSEGDSPRYGTHPGRVAWFDPPDWEPTFLREDLFCPHSLQVADFTGGGKPDIFVGEMGLGEHDDPKLLVYEDLGDGVFEEHLIGSGIPTHEATAVDLTGNGRPDIVGKSYGPACHVDVWYNETGT